MKERFKRIWAFIKTPVFWYNLAGAVGFFLLFIFLGNSMLSRYTHHGESLTVPDVRGLTYEEAKQRLDDANLDYSILDSSFVLNKKPLSVLDQQPRANSKVKRGRTVYLTINAKVPPKIKMPDLTNTSFVQACQVLDQFGLRLGQKIYKPDLAKNTVLDQLSRGARIAPGADIVKGSTIDLVVGDGLGSSEMEVPNVLGMSLREAISLLEMSDLNVGSVVRDKGVSDSLNATVWKQNPDFFSSDHNIHLGEYVDVWVTNDEAKVKDALNNQMKKKGRGGNVAAPPAGKGNSASGNKNGKNDKDKKNK